MSRQRKKNRTSRAGAGTLETTISKFFYKIQVWGHKEKTYSFCKTPFAELDVKTAGKKIVPLEPVQAHLKPNFPSFSTKWKNCSSFWDGQKKKQVVEHCLDTEGFSLFKMIQPMFLPILYTVLTSILPLFVAAHSLLSWHLLHPPTFLLRTNIVTIFSTKC